MDGRLGALERGGLAAPILALGLFIALSALFRPILPPDETRYLTVAWEMVRSGDFVLPTVNGVLYDQKPPLLLWLIDAVWQITGPNRAGALLTVFLISSASVVLSRRLAQEVFPGEAALHRRIGWAMVGNAVFAIYSGLVLFDLLMTCGVLIALIGLLTHARRRRLSSLALAGLGIALSLLAKGPAGLLFLVPIVLAYPLWREERHCLSTGAFLLAGLAALLLGILLTGIWLVPAFIASDGAYLKGLIFDQMAGRISGTMRASHHRAVWFYLPLLPLFALPWLASPVVWRRHAETLRKPGPALKSVWLRRPAVRLLVVAIVVPIALFSAVGGKQPHYLVPLIPFVAIGSALALRDIPLRLIASGAGIVLSILVAAQALGQATVLARYDLTPLARLVARWQGPVAFAGTYQGELGFLAGLTAPLAVVPLSEAASWLERHPDGLLVSSEWKTGDQVPGRLVLDRPFETKQRMTASIP